MPHRRLWTWPASLNALGLIAIQISETFTGLLVAIRTTVFSDISSSVLLVNVSILSITIALGSFHIPLLGSYKLLQELG